MLNDGLGPMTLTTSSVARRFSMMILFLWLRVTIVLVAVF
uniref:Transport protein n=1 Tax=Ascaris lumbricoides TaxID=6252 RepID=A0A0M3HS33_ASCLU